MKLFGHDTSPYVRRVRALFHELDVPFERDKGGWKEPSPELLRVTPIGRVPVMTVDRPNGELVLLDSKTIAEYLLTHHAPRTDEKVMPFQPTMFHPAHRYEDDSVLSLVDAALDSGIQIFMCDGDGIPPDAPTLQRQTKRMNNCLAALDKIFAKRVSLHDDVFGYVDLALGCSLEWFLFRKVAEISAHAHLYYFLEQNRSRPSLATTDPRLA